VSPAGGSPARPVPPAAPLARHDGARPADEDEEGGLEGVLGVVVAAERTRRHTPQTIGPCRRTRAANAASSRRRMKHSRSSPSVIPAPPRRSTARQRWRQASLSGPVIGNPSCLRSDPGTPPPAPPRSGAGRAGLGWLPCSPAPFRGGGWGVGFSDSLSKLTCPL